MAFPRSEKCKIEKRRTGGQTLASRVFAAILTSLACAFAAAPASANGRFPFANQLVPDPGNASHLALRTTYGFIQTFDAGKTWRWLCERSVGYGGSFDPAIAITSSGMVLAGVFNGLRATTDRGCTWQLTGVPLDKEFVIDIAADRSDPRRVVAMTSSGLGDAGFRVLVAETTDGGQTWTKLETNLPTDFNSETIELAKSDRNRIYTSGTVGTTPRLGAIERSDDHGKTWTRYTIDIEGARAPFISAVDPTNPDRVYVRVEGDAAADAGSVDRLLVSDDGAKTFREIARVEGRMLGFALSPDGARVALGGPAAGVRVASTTDFKFAQTASVTVRCLTWTNDGLYVCGTEYPDGFTVAKSPDEGKTLQPLYNLSNLSQLDCAASTPTATLCATDWVNVRDTIGVADDDAGVDASPPADASTGAKPVDAPAPGCGCSVLGERAGMFALLSSAIALTVLIARRR